MISEWQKGSRIAIVVTILFIFMSVQIALGGIGMYVVCATGINVIFLTLIYLNCKKPSTDANAEYDDHMRDTKTEDLVNPLASNLVEEEEGMQGMEVGGTSSTTRMIADGHVYEVVDRRPKTRILYLDNLKSFLTVLVLLHHTACTFCGPQNSWFIIIGNYKQPLRLVVAIFLTMNQSYFMALFFFIAAFFVPKSLTRKGVLIFLKDRFNRLGIPFIFATYAMIPLMIFAVAKFCDFKYKYVPMAGQMWFAGWLLLFTVTYVWLKDGSPGPYSIAFPQEMYKIALFIFIGSIVMGICLVLLGGSFFYMPISFGTLPFYILFFWAGVTASNSKWLVEGERDSILTFIDRHRTVMKVTVVVLFLVLVGVYLYFYIQNAELFEGPNALSWLLLLLLITSTFCVFLSLLVLDVFRVYASYTTEFTKFVAAQAYTVYIIHPLVLVGLTMFYIKYVIEPVSGIDVSFYDADTSKNGTLSSTNLKEYTYLLWVGFFFVGSMGVCISWGMAALIKKIPGIDSIL